MFTDCLEVEENLKMSRKLSNQDNGGEIKDTYKLVGPYKKKEEVSVPSKTSHGMQKDDRPEDGIGSLAGLFFEDGDLHRPWSTKDDFTRDFGMPMYDEYEEEYLQNAPDETIVGTKPYHMEGIKMQCKIRRLKRERMMGSLEMIAYPCVMPLLN